MSGGGPADNAGPGIVSGGGPVDRGGGAVRPRAGGGPAGATTTIEYYIYNNAYQWFKMGYASSIAWVLFVVILVITLLNWRFGGRRVTY